jgi:hypothetical protein
VKIYRVITKRQMQKVRVIGSKAKENITKIIVKEVKKFSNNNKGLR